ncbi:LamG domain-containing protein [Candidatus Poribacteria bacterium]
MKPGNLSIMSAIFISLVLFALPIGSTWAGIIQNGLISHWTLDEAGNVEKDNAGNSNGELMNGAQAGAGKLDNGLALDGVDDHMKVATLDISPGIHAELTLMVWVFPTSTGAGGQKNRRFLFGHDDGGWDRGLLMQDSNWRAGTGNDGTDYWDTGVEVTLETWQHVALVYSAEDIKFYKDGEEYSYGSPGDIGDGNPALLIGAHPSQARYFQGIIDEICVYDRALAQDEIRRNIAALGLPVESKGKLSTVWGKLKRNAQ